MQIFSKLPSQKRWLFWIIFAIVVKSLFFIYALPHEDTSLQDTPYNKTFAVTTVETPSYLEPAENFINTGHYDAKKWGDLRPPGYAWPYCLLRSFLSITWTLNVLDLIQLLLSAISVFALARVAYLIFKKESYFYLTFFL